MITKRVSLSSIKVTTCYERGTSLQVRYLGQTKVSVSEAEINLDVPSVGGSDDRRSLGAAGTGWVFLSYSPGLEWAQVVLEKHERGTEDRERHRQGENQRETDRETDRERQRERCRKRFIESGKSVLKKKEIEKKADGSRK